MIVQISKVKPNPNNPRIIKDEKFAKLVKSIQEFPDMLNKRPLVCYTDTDGQFVVLGGNMRLKAAKECKLKEIPIILADEWTSEQRAEFLIKDNVGFGEWDWEQLANEWDVQQLEDWGLDVPGFQGEELEAQEDDYEIPDVVQTDIVLGDLFEIGEHRLLCGDSTDSDQVAKLMNGQKADMVFTDPPYGVSYTGGLKNGENGLEQNGRQMIKNDDIDLYEDAVIIADMFCSGPVFMFYADTVPFGLYRGVENVKGQVIALLIWKKEGGYGALGASYKPNHEPCLLWKTKGSNLNFIGDTTENRIWEIKKDGKNKLHPTQKPIEIPARAIGNHKADKVLDLFCGSGSTMVAAHQLKRKCYGMELEPKYCQVIIDRMRKLDPNIPIKKNGVPL
jgi:site-specific DNA-methyltransferase (adenine-specific)